MKRMLCSVLLIVLISLTIFCSCASAEAAGFGMINANDVAIRVEPRGQKITRLQKGSSVWITGSKEDSRGEMWYQVRAQEYAEGSHTNRRGWVKAEFVNAGSDLWHDVKTVKAAIFGMTALKTDGTVLCAGDSISADTQNRYAGLRDIRQIGTCTIGWEFFAVDGNGRLYRGGIEQNIPGKIRLAGSNDLICISEDNRLQANYDGSTRIVWVYPQNGDDVQYPHVISMADVSYRNLFLTDDGKVYCAYLDDMELGYPEPDWEKWTDAVSIDASLCSRGTYVLNGHTLRKYVPAFTAVRKDGTVLAAPAELAELTADWQDIRKTAIGSDWILGLKQDGTVLAAGIDGRTPPDVSGWTDITDISNGHTYCVGVKNDGTLVFAGDFTFSDD